MLEEVRDPRQLRLVDVGVVLDVGVEGRQLGVGRSKDLFVLPAFIFHQQHADRPRAHDAARDQLGLAQNHDIDGVAIVRKRVRHEAVIAGIAHGRVQEAIHENRAGVLVELVLDRLTADRDFDDDVDVLGRVLPAADLLDAHGALRRNLDCCGA